VRTGFIVVDALLAGDGAGFVTALEHLALPVCCLSLYPAAQVCAVLQARLRERRLQTLITSLRARGLGPARIWLGHVLRIVSAPVITAVGSNFGSLLGGAVLTETVFSWPGIGRYLAAAVIERDLYVVQNVLLMVILLAVLAIVASDFVAWLVNPVAMRESAGRGEEGSR
jgi:ABC-type dipeptide/oligopeptide/nickel transport system permease component